MTPDSGYYQEGRGGVEGVYEKEQMLLRRKLILILQEAIYDAGNIPFTTEYCCLR